MLNAKNLHLIQDKIANYSVNDFKEIIGFNYLVDVYDSCNTSFLEVKFNLIPKDRSNTFRVVVKFNNVSGLKINGIAQIIYLTGFEIADLKEKGWDSHQRYFVNDYEDSQFEFYCAGIEIITVDLV